MKEISRFCTLFWVLYFPLCIAYYELVNDYTDEFMTLILILFTIIELGNRNISRESIKEAALCVAFFLFYLIYSLIKHVNVPEASIIDFQQQIRPYAVFYCMLILMPQYTAYQRRLMLFSIVASLVGYIIWKRSSLFGSEDLILGSLSIGAGMMWYLFTKEKPINRYIATGIVLFGLICGKYKYIGECVAFVIVVFLLRRRVRIGSGKSAWLAGLIVATAIYFAWTRFDAYFISGLDNKELARPMMYKTAPKIIKDYFPFGSGLATFGTSASAKTYYSPLYYKYELSDIWGMAPEDRGAFNADSFYPSLAQFGVFGLIMFFLFWRRRIFEINNIRDLRYYKICIMAMLCLAIESVADTSYLSGRGMIYFMLLALCLDHQVKEKRVRKRHLLEDIIQKGLVDNKL